MIRKFGILAAMLAAMLAALLAMILTGCGKSPSQEYTLGNNVRSEQFNAVDAWEEFISETISFRVEDGVYRAFAPEGGWIWGLDVNGATHTDVVIEVETEQLSSYNNNGYGVLCRADVSNNGDGYYFAISGDGFYLIGRGNGDSIDSLVEWTQSDKINQGQARNTIRAVCMGDYLALYVNGDFVAEARDSMFSSGLAGFAVAAESQTVDIVFDNLNVWEVTPRN